MVDISTPGKLAGQFGQKWMGQAQKQQFSNQYAAGDQQLQLQARQQQQQYGALLQAQMAGQGPSLAQDQLSAGIAQAQRAGMNTAASARGANVALAGRTAAQNTGRMALGGAREAAMLRSQEQLAAQQQYGGLLEAQRQADLQARGLGVDIGKAQLAADTQMTDANANRGQKGAGGALVAVGGLVGSDPAFKSDMAPVGSFRPGGAAGYQNPAVGTRPTGGAFQNPAAMPDPNAAPAPGAMQLQLPAYQAPSVDAPPMGQTPTAPPTQPAPTPQPPSLYNQPAGGYGYQNPFAVAMNMPYPRSGVAWKEQIAPADGTLARSDFNRFTDQTVGSRLPRGPQPETLGVANTLADRGPSYPYGKPSSDKDTVSNPTQTPANRTMAQKFWDKISGKKSSAELKREDEEAKGSKPKADKSFWDNLAQGLIGGGNAVSGIGGGALSDPDEKEQASMASHPLVYGAAQAQPYTFRYKEEAAAQEGVSTEPRTGMMASKMPGSMADNPVYAPTVIKDPNGYDRIDGPQALMANVAVTTDVARKQAEDSRRIAQLEALLETATKAMGSAGEKAGGKRFTRQDVQGAPQSPKGKGGSAQRAVPGGSPMASAKLDIGEPRYRQPTMQKMWQQAPVEERAMDRSVSKEEYAALVDSMVKRGGDATIPTRRQVADERVMSNSLEGLTRKFGLPGQATFDSLPDTQEEAREQGLREERFDAPMKPRLAAAKKAPPKAKAKPARKPDDVDPYWDSWKSESTDVPQPAWMINETTGKRVRIGTKQEAITAHEEAKTDASVAIRKSLDNADADPKLNRRIQNYAQIMAGSASAAYPSSKEVHKQLIKRGVNISLPRVKQALEEVDL